MKKAVVMNWVARADLSNLNSGQGVGNLTELKLYRGNHYPYISGQSVRRALFDTIAREHPHDMKCPPESPCGQIDNCWACDLRGFLIAEKIDENLPGIQEKRWSPIKVTPALGQIPVDIATDMLLQFVHDSNNKIANVQLAENLYRIGMAIDVAQIGLQMAPRFEKAGGKKAGDADAEKGKKERFAGWDEEVNVGEEQRRRRVHAVLDAVYRLSGFAKQARGAVSLAPEVLVATVQNHYHQRGVDVLDLDDRGNVNIERVTASIQEHQAAGDAVLFGFTPGVVANGRELVSAVAEQGIPSMRVFEVLERVKALVE